MEDLKKNERRRRRGVREKDGRKRERVREREKDGRKKEKHTVFLRIE